MMSWSISPLIVVTATAVAGISDRWLEFGRNGSWSLSSITTKFGNRSLLYRIDGTDLHSTIGAVFYESGAVGAVYAGDGNYQVNYDTRDRFKGVSVLNSSSSHIAIVFQPSGKPSHPSFVCNECKDARDVVCGTGAISMCKLVNHGDNFRATTRLLIQSLCQAMTGSCCSSVTRKHICSRYCKENDPTSTEFGNTSIKDSRRELTPLVRDKSSHDSSQTPTSARIGYLILANGIDEMRSTKNLLKALYHRQNFYLVHLDREDDDPTRKEMNNFVSDWENVR